MQHKVEQHKVELGAAVAKVADLENGWLHCQQGEVALISAHIQACHI